MRHPWRNSSSLQTCSMRPNGIPKMDEKSGYCEQGSPPTWSFISGKKHQGVLREALRQQHAPWSRLRYTAAAAPQLPAEALRPCCRTCEGLLEPRHATPVIHWTNYFLQLISQELGSEWIIHDKSIPATNFCSTIHYSPQQFIV